jgi:hypothetical protein
MTDEVRMFNNRPQRAEDWLNWSSQDESLWRKAIKRRVLICLLKP